MSEMRGMNEMSDRKIIIWRGNNKEREKGGGKKGERKKKKKREKREAVMGRKSE